MQTNKLGRLIKYVSTNARGLNKQRQRPCLDNLCLSRDKNVYACTQPIRYLTTTSILFQISETRLASSKNDEARIEFKGGHVKLVLKLPARGEHCEFNLKLINQTVGDLVEQIKHEDKSIEKCVFYSIEGVRLAQNTPLGILVSQPFQLKLNDLTYHVDVSHELIKKSEIDLELENQSKKDLDQIKHLVSKLYLHLNIEQYELEREHAILKELEKLKSEIEPLEKIKEELVLKAKRHTNRLVWVGLAAMSIQMGILARLTWFDYSWDIVEPISYFVSYSAVIGVYAYFVLTRKEYDYESASDRIFLRNFHKNACKSNLNVSRYNEIKSKIYLLENDLVKIKEAHLRNFEKHIQNKN